MKYFVPQYFLVHHSYFRRLKVGFIIREPLEGELSSHVTEAMAGKTLLKLTYVMLVLKYDSRYSGKENNPLNQWRPYDSEMEST